MESFQNTSLYANTIFVLSADNVRQPTRQPPCLRLRFCQYSHDKDGFHVVHVQGGILNGGYNWPYRGQKATYWEGGARAVGFIHSALLQKTGFVYNGLVHVSDWSVHLPACLRLRSLPPPCARWSFGVWNLAIEQPSSWSLLASCGDDSSLSLAANNVASWLFRLITGFRPSTASPAGMSWKGWTATMSGVPL